MPSFAQTDHAVVACHGLVDPEPQHTLLDHTGKDSSGVRSLGVAPHADATRLFNAEESRVVFLIQEATISKSIHLDNVSTVRGHIWKYDDHI